MGPLGLVEPQRLGQGVEDALRGAGEAAAFHADVVVDRDAGEHRHLLAAQSRHAAVAAVCRQAGLFGVMRARRVLRKSRISVLRSMVPMSPR